MLFAVALLEPVAQGLMTSGLSELIKSATSSAELSNGVFASLDRVTIEEMSTAELSDHALEAVKLDIPPPYELVDVRAYLSALNTQTLIYELFVARLLLHPLEEQESIAEALESTASASFSTAKGFASQIVEQIDIAIGIVERRLDALNPELRQTLRAQVGLSSATASLAGIKRHLQSLLDGPPLDSLLRKSFVDNYKAHVISRHAFISVSDVEAERRVDIEKIYVQAPLQSKTVIEAATQIPSLLRHAVLMGNPGAGKSTSVDVIATALAREPLARVPFVVTLRNYLSDLDKGLSIIDHMEIELRTRYQITTPTGLLNQLCLSGEALFMFDGLDELVDVSRRREIRQAVEAFAFEYPATRVIVTSRIVGYDQAPLDDTFEQIRIADFSDEAVRDYVSKWFAILPETLSSVQHTQLTDSFLSESASAADLRKTPLLLSLMCVLYRRQGFIPENRLRLYEECTKLLFRQWDRSRGISFPIEMSYNMDSALMDLASWIYGNDSAETGVTESDLTQRTVGFLVPEYYEHTDQATEVAEQFISYCRGRAWVLADAGSTDDGDRLYTFTHRTFLEFYAAMHVVRMAESVDAIADELIPHLLSEQWEVVAQLALQAADAYRDRGATRILERILDSGSGEGQQGEPTLLSFCAKALAVVTPSPLTTRRIARLVCLNELARAELLSELPDHPELSQVKGAFEASDYEEIQRAIRQHELIQDEFVTIFRENLTRVNPNCHAIATILFYARPPSSNEAEQAVRDLWTEWARGVLHELWPALKDAEESWMFSLGSLENGFISFTDYLTRYPFGSLFQGLSFVAHHRVSCMQLLLGWAAGRFVPSAFERSVGETLLTSVRDWVLMQDTPPVVSSLFSLGVVIGQSYPPPPINGRAREGSVLLNCFEADLNGLPKTVPQRRELLAEKLFSAGLNAGALSDLLPAREDPADLGVEVSAEVSDVLRVWLRGGMQFVTRPDLLSVQDEAP